MLDHFPETSGSRGARRGRNLEMALHGAISNSGPSLRVRAGMNTVVQAMGTVGHPASVALDVFPWGDGRSSAHHGDQIAVARTFTGRTQKPVSSLWNVTRSTLPARCSRRVSGVECGVDRGIAASSHHGELDA